jgi:SAM-dependent methyltransferase
MSDNGPPRSRWLDEQGVSGDDYDRAYREKERAGENVHGEADFVQSYGPRSVLDAGCGTGRVAIELARRGIEAVGVDIDERMLGTARKNAPHLEWHLGDISSIDLGRRFDAIVMAGNVMIFLAPGTEGAVLRNLAQHLSPDGVLIAGFQLAMGYLELDEYDRLADEAGLVLKERWSSWHRDRFDGYSNYAVSVHTRGGDSVAGSRCR